MTEINLSDELLEGWTVLVVDDEPDNIEVVQILLEMCGARVVSAPDGREGYRMAMTHLPNFIISDLSMPEASGWKMLSMLKNNLSTQNIPVIALTAHAMKGDREMAFGAGFHNYLTKPLVPETFVHDVLSLLLDVPNIVELLNKK